MLTILILLAFSLALGIALTPLGDAGARLPPGRRRPQLAAPFAAVAWTLTYFRLRELERFARPGRSRRRRSAVG